MTPSFKLRVLMALTAALRQITIANGYQFELGDSVYRGRLLLTAKDPVPCLAINEPPTTPEDLFSPEGSALIRNAHMIIIQGFVADDLDNPTDPAYLLLADVQKCLAEELTRDEGFDILGFGPRVTSLRLGSPIVRPPEASVSIHSLFWLPLTLGYVEDLKYPFA